MIARWPGRTVAEHIRAAGHVCYDLRLSASASYRDEGAPINATYAATYVCRDCAEEFPG